jgi:tight adherence protein B
LAPILGCIGLYLPVAYVQMMGVRRLKAFEAVFPDALEFIARSMRAGHAFAMALDMMKSEFPEPLAGEFRRTFEEHNLGLPLDVALQKLSLRIPLIDVHFFVSAVMLQKRTGGNLAEILDKLAFIIRERFKLKSKIKAVSAHGRMTAVALSCVPIGVGALMLSLNTEYQYFFFHQTVGQLLLGAGGLLQIIGYAVMNNIVKIEI